MCIVPCSGTKEAPATTLTCKKQKYYLCGTYQVRKDLSTAA
jgi:hypothetical protein